MKKLQNIHIQLSSLLSDDFSIEIVSPEYLKIVRWDEAKRLTEM
jgi:hypothetical protein